MLLMARAILQEHSLMMIDEISERLQPTVVQTMGDILKAECCRRQVSIMVVEQNMPFACAIADRFAVLKLGEIVAHGSMKNPDSRGVVEKYLNV